MVKEKGQNRREAVIVLTASAAFLLFQWLVVGLIPAQVLMVALFLLMFFAESLPLGGRFLLRDAPQASPWAERVGARRLAVALLPFVVFEVSYDWMRLCPNYLVNDIDVRGLYETEKSLFGIVLPEYFYAHHCTLADLLSGLFYLCWVPGPMAVGLWLYFTGRRRQYLHFAIAFLVVNWLGFAIYYIHPAAPPWYVIEHGFEPILGTLGSAAGLVRFDELVGLPVFQSIYVNNSNIFAAVPSLHAAYMLVATIYAVRAQPHPQPLPRKEGRSLRCCGFAIRDHWLIALCIVITLGIWFAAVYTCHHYVIDVLLGIVTAFLGVFLFEYLLMRLRPVSRFMAAYERYVS